MPPSIFNLKVDKTFQVLFLASFPMLKPFDLLTFREAVFRQTDVCHAHDSKLRWVW